MSGVIDTHQNCSGVVACLREQGIETVIRYYSEFTNLPQKRLRPEEAATLSAAGLKLCAVYQDAQNTVQHFTLSRGLQRGRYAYRYAQDTIRQPPKSAIYFAVDFDASADEIETAVAPFFKGISRAFDEESGGLPDYVVGVYGLGLVCRMVVKEGLASYAWLAAARGWRETKRFDESGKWHLKQSPATTLCGLDVDFNMTNKESPDFGSFVADLESLVLPAPGATVGRAHQVTARNGLRLRAGPGTSFDAIGNLPFGTRLHVLAQTGDWGKVDLQDDGRVDGFAHMQFLGPLS